jgi:hypothetical protein
MVKIEAVKLKTILIMHQGSFRNQPFCSASTEGFDKVEYFYFFIHWIRYCEGGNKTQMVRPNHPD